MTQNLNYPRAKRYARTRRALHTTQPDTDTPPRPVVSLRGWRLSDGREYPVTTRKISTKETTNA